MGMPFAGIPVAGNSVARIFCGGCLVDVFRMDAQETPGKNCCSLELDVGGYIKLYSRSGDQLGREMNVACTSKNFLKYRQGL